MAAVAVAAEEAVAVAAIDFDAQSHILSLALGH